MNLSTENAWVAATIRDFLEVAHPHYRYFLLGSAALISYTDGKGYQRKVKDVDLIGDTKGFERVASGLVQKGYAQGTFIEKSHPFATQLLRLARTKYCRFVKDGRSLEIMTTDFGDREGRYFVELYPGIAFNIPSDVIQTTHLGTLPFQAVSPELLLMIYRFGSRTWGMFVKRHEKERWEDMKQLSTVADEERIAALAKNISLRIGQFRLRIPAFLLR